MSKINKNGKKNRIEICDFYKTLTRFHGSFILAQMKLVRIPDHAPEEDPKVTVVADPNDRQKMQVEFYTTKDHRELFFNVIHALHALPLDVRLSQCDPSMKTKQNKTKQNSRKIIDASA
jgi:hypothetical protein